MATKEELRTGAEDCGQQVGQAAGRLYQVAAMLLGNPAAALELVEGTLAAVTVDPCADQVEAQYESECRLAAQSVDWLVRKQGRQALAVPEYAVVGDLQGCMDLDELDSAGVTASQLQSALNGPQPEKMREWLEALTTAERAVFVLRAVLDFGNEAVADVLAKGNSANGVTWSAQSVSKVYQSTLCSLNRASVSQAFAEEAVIRL
ncbi:MAG: RNA polymerase sigma factor [Acidobacteriaceae bacterium]